MKAQRENLGPTINSTYDEIYPIISADGKTLFFVRKEHPENVGGVKDDIWYSEMKQDGTWGQARNVGYPLNNSGYNYVCYALPDNNTLLLGNNYLPDGSQRQGVSMSYRSEGGWKPPINLYINNFRNKSKNCEFAMSPDGTVLIMSIEEERTRGERDLYVSFLNEDNTWSEPENMGAVVNSSYSDITPFLAADGITLYYSSARPGGFGSNDIYMSRRLDDTWKLWSPPVNLGYPINTAGWDAYYTVPASGEYAYFVSTNSGYGRSDVFRIRLPKEAMPKPVLLVRGTVKDIHGQILPAKIFYERFSDNKQVGTAIANPTTGEYTLALPGGDQYGFRAELEGYFPISENIDLRDLENYQEIMKDLILVPIEAGNTVRLNNIFFDYDKWTLRPESEAELDRLVTFMNSQPDINIQINGHTDGRGTVEYNIILSQHRAQSVVDYLILKGVSPDRLVAKGFGKSMPIDTNETDEGRQQNRRVEFTIF